MGFGDVFDPGDVGELAGTFVVNDDIEAFGPIRFFVSAVFDVFVGGIASVNNGPGDVGAGADAVAQDFFLRLVIVAAAAGDE